MAKARSLLDRILDAAGFKVTGLPTPTAHTDAVPLGFVTPGAGLLQSSGVDGAVSIAAVGTAYQKPLAFQGAHIVTGTPADTVVPDTAVANLTALASLTNVPDGWTANVQTLDRSYTLDLASVDTADGMNVITNSGGTGRWHARLSPSVRWTSVSDWTIDPANGAANDENPGTTASGLPLKTWGELERRLYKSRVANTANLVIRIASSLTATDTVFCDFVNGSNGTYAIYVVGTRTVASGFPAAITGYTARSPSTNGVTQMAISSIPTSWTASGLVGLRAEYANGSSSVGAWVEEDLGSKTAHLSIPHIASTVVGSPNFGAETQFINGNSVSVYSVPTVPLVNLAVVPVGTSLYFVDLNIATAYVTASAPNFIACKIGAYRCFSGEISLVNCKVTAQSTNLAGSLVYAYSGTSFTGTIAIGGGLYSFHAVTVRRIFAALGGSAVKVDFQADVEYFSTTTDDINHYLIQVQVGGGNTINFWGNVYGKPLNRLAWFTAAAGNNSKVFFAKQPTIGSWCSFDNANDPANRRDVPVADLATSSFQDEFGNEVMGPAKRTVSAVTRVLQNTFTPSFRYAIVHKNTAGSWDLAQADTAAHATGALAVLFAYPQTGQTTTDSGIGATAGRTLVQFTSAPAVGDYAYLSTTAGQASNAPPAVSGTNQFRPLGIVVAVSGTLGLVEWAPVATAVPAFDTTLTWTGVKFDPWGRPIPQTAGATLTTAYQTLRGWNGTAVADAIQRTKAYFTNGDFDVADDGVNAWTQVSLHGVVTAATLSTAGSVVGSLQFDAKGRVLAASLTALNYQTVQDSTGTPVTVAPVLKFAAPHTVATAAGVTTVGLATVTPASSTSSTGVFLTGMTFNAWGIPTAYTTAAAVTQGYTTVKDSTGASLAARVNLKAAARLLVTDVTPDTVLDLANAGAGAAVYGGGGNGIASIALDQWGRPTAITTFAIVGAYTTVKDSTGASLPARSNLKFTARFAPSDATPDTLVDLATTITGAAFGGGANIAIAGFTADNFGRITVAPTTIAVPSAAAGYITAASETSLSGEFALNGLAAGLLWNAATGVASTTLRRAIPGTDYESGITFSLGLTRVANNVTNDVITGIVGGQAWRGSTSAGGNLFIYASANPAPGAFYLTGALAYQFAQTAATTGTPGGLVYTGAAHTGLATAEYTDALFDFGRSVQFVAGNITTVRAMRVAAPTYAFATGSTINEAATVAISGAPIAGANATLTNSYALWVQSGAVRLDGLGTGVVFSNAGLLVAVSTSTWEAPLTFTSPGLTRAVNTISNDVFTGASPAAVTWKGSTAAGGTLTIQAGTSSPGTMTLQGGGGTTATALLLTQSSAFGGTGTARGVLGAVSRVTPSGAADFRAYELGYTINQTGSSTGATRGLLVSATVTAVIGTHLVLDLQVGGASQFSVGPSGTITTQLGSGMVKSASGVLGLGVSGTDFEPGLTFSSGLTRVTNTITNDVVTGVAIGSTAWRGTSVTGGQLFIYASTAASPGTMFLVAGAYNLANLANGMLKVTSNVLTPAVAGTDFENPLTFSTGLTRTANNVTNDVYVGNSSSGITWRGSTASGGTLTIQSGTINPGTLTLQGGGGTNATGIALTQSAASSGTGTGRGLLGTVSRVTASGALDFRAYELGYTINQSGSSTGNTRGLLVSSTVTARTGVHYLLDLQVNGSSRFNIDESGNIATLLGAGIVVSTIGSPLSTIPTTTYENPLTFSNGLTRAANAVSNDVFSGSSAAGVTWNGSNAAGGSLTIRAGTLVPAGLALQSGGNSIAAGTTLSAAQPFNSTSTSQSAVLATPTFSPSSGGAAFSALKLAYTIAQSGSASGTIYGLNLDVTATSILGQHVFQRAAINGTELWRLHGNGKMWMTSGASVTATGDIGMSGWGRPLFVHYSTGSSPVMATNDPLFVFNFSGAHVGNIYGLCEASWANPGASTANNTRYGLGSSTDTWASHATQYRNEFALDFAPLYGKTLKMRSLIVVVTGAYGDGSTGDTVWSLYKITPGAGSATITEVARTGTFGDTGVPVAIPNATFRQDGQNIAPSATWSDNDRFMLTSRNTSIGGVLSGSNPAVISFTAIVRFDVAED